MFLIYHLSIAPNEGISRIDHGSVCDISNNNLCEFDDCLCTGRSQYDRRGRKQYDRDASKLAPTGSAKGIKVQGENIFVLVCPRDFQSIKQCEIFVAQPTLVAIKTVKAK